MPALAAATIELHTAGSTLPLERYPLGITKLIPADTRHEAVEELNCELISTPYADDVGVDPFTQHSKSDGPTQ